MIKKPSLAQEKLFINKTIKHIRLVQSNMKKIAGRGGTLGVIPVDIIRRAFLHDFSKFDADIYEGYVWYNVRNHAREKGWPLPEYDKETEDFIFAAVRKHRSQSRHHPEYYESVNDMEPLDIIEMVCDWTAVSQEFKDGTYKTSRELAESVIGPVYGFDAEHERYIYSIIDLLTELNGREW